MTAPSGQTVRRVGVTVAWHLVGLGITAAWSFVTGWVVFFALAIGAAMPLTCSDSDAHFDTPPLHTYAAASTATVVSTALLAPILWLVLRSRVHRPGRVAAGMALLGAFSVGAAMVLATYLGYRHNGPRTPCSALANVTVPDLYGEIWLVASLALLAVSLVATVRARAAC